VCRQTPLVSDAEFAELEREQVIPTTDQVREDAVGLGRDVDRCLSGESVDELCTRVCDCLNLPATPAGERAAQINMSYQQLPFGAGQHASHMV